MVRTASYSDAAERSRSYPIFADIDPADAVDSALFAGTVVGVSTLSERIAWIFANRTSPDGRRWTQRGLSAAAGLSPAHVGMMARGDAKAVKGETLAAVARTTGVSLAWLTTGDGSPDHDDDTRGPSTSDDGTPVMQNAVGWEDVVRFDRIAHPDITDDEVLAAAHSARFMLHRPAVAGDLWEIVQTVRKMHDASWLAQKIRERDARLEKVLAGIPEQQAWEQAQLAKKAARGQR